MANSIYTRNRRLYVVPVTTYGTAVAPSNGNATRYIDITFQPAQAESTRPDLNPSLDATVGLLGRKTTSYSGSASLAGSAAAGTAPDLGPIFKSCLGAVAVVSSTSVTYSEDDPMSYVDLYQYVSPSTGNHEALLSAFVKTLEIEFGGDYAIVRFAGEGKSYASSSGLTALDTEGKSGLSAFPTEPASPVVNGAAVSGYRGTITLDGNVYTIARSGKCTVDNQAELQKDGWGSDYPQDGAKDVRRVTQDISLYDDDSSNLNALKGKADSGTPVTMAYVLGQTAGGIFTITERNVIMAKPSYDNSGKKRVVNFNGCVAHATTGTSKDAITIAIT